MVAEELANLKKGRPTENAGIQAFSQADAAKLMQVSRDSVQKAAKIKREAPKLAAEAVGRRAAPPTGRGKWQLSCRRFQTIGAWVSKEIAGIRAGIKADAVDPLPNKTNG
jgi:hypothetical protein